MFLYVFLVLGAAFFFFKQESIFCLSSLNARALFRV